MTDILNSNINNDLIVCVNVEKAPKIVEESFNLILDQHAPVKTFQMRKHYFPYVSDQTKALMMESNWLKVDATGTGDRQAEKELKKKVK